MACGDLMKAPNTLLAKYFTNLKKMYSAVFSASKSASNSVSFALVKYYEASSIFNELFFQSWGIWVGIIWGVLGVCGIKEAAREPRERLGGKMMQNHHGVLMKV